MYGPPLSHVPFGHPESPTSSINPGHSGRWNWDSRLELFRAGIAYDIEKYLARCKESVPNYEPHPAYLRLVEMAKPMLPLIDSPKYLFLDFIPDELEGRMLHPWDYMEDAHEYKCFCATLEDLDKTWHDEHPPPPPWYDSFTFTAQELLDAGVALETEMQDNNCTADFPDYQPRPAYIHFAAMWEKLIYQIRSPLELIHAKLGRQGMLQWLSLESVYRIIDSNRGTFGGAFLLPHGPAQGDDNDFVDASDLVATFEQLEVTSIPAEDSICPICQLTFDKTQSNFDESPVKTPCCHRIFGKHCYIEALQFDKRCPMCRCDVTVSDFEHVPAPDVTDSAAEAEIDMPDETETL